MENHPSSPTPEELAHTYEQSIVQAITDQFGLPTQALHVRHTDAYTSELDNSTTFIVQHSTGLYAVNAVVNDEGGLESITAANLQSDALQQ